MPARRHDREWREAEDDAVVRIGRALDDFSAQTGIRRSALAAAVGSAPSDLSPSHLRKRAAILVWVLRRTELPAIATRLGLELSGFRALELLSASVQEALGGFTVEPGSFLGTPRETADVGAVGVALFDNGEWAPAITHLNHAWTELAARSRALDEPEFAVALRVGTQLTDWLTYQDRRREAVSVSQKLLGWASAYRGANTGTLHAIALAHKAAAVAAHAQPLTRPSRTIRIAEDGDRILRDHKLDPLARVALLREQAKPYIAWAFETGDASYFQEANRVLTEAQRLATCLPKDTEADRERLLTHLTHVQCLALTSEDPAECRAAGDDILSESTSPFAPGSSLPTVSSKLDLTRLALTAAAGRMDEAIEQAHRFIANPAYAAHGNRLRRVRAILQSLEASDTAALRSAILR